MFVADSSPFEWTSQHIQLLGWPTMCLIAWKARGALDKMFTGWQTIEKTSAESHKVIELVKADVQTMSTNHLFHIEKDMRELNEKHSKVIETLQSIDTGISVLVDRGRT
jgi:hypothetical protein